MFISLKERKKRGNTYAERYDLTIEDRLGWGTQGSVFATNRRSAVKIHDRESHYQRERDVYFRLREHNVAEIGGFAVPRLVNHDDELWVVEMTIVQAPFIVDFASAYLDHRPDYPAATLEEHRAQKEEDFGENWIDVQLLIAELERHEIYLVDIHRDNIRFS